MSDAESARPCRIDRTTRSVECRHPQWHGQLRPVSPAPTLRPKLGLRPWLALQHGGALRYLRLLLLGAFRHDRPLFTLAAEGSEPVDMVVAALLDVADGFPREPRKVDDALGHQVPRRATTTSPAEVLEFALFDGTTFAGRGVDRGARVGAEIDSHLLGDPRQRRRRGGVRRGRRTGAGSSSTAMATGGGLGCRHPRRRRWRRLRAERSGEHFLASIDLDRLVELVQRAPAFDGGDAHTRRSTL